MTHRIGFAVKTSLAVLLACGMFTLCGAPASEAANVTVLQEEQVPPPLPEPMDASGQEVIMAAPVEIPLDHISCPPVTYRATKRCRCLPPPTVKTTLLVEDPKFCGCYAKVPICIPACCEGEAKVCPQMGILGRRRVIYTWECGLVVDVLFRTRGDIVVTYDCL